MLTQDAINRVHAANGGQVKRHQFGHEPHTPVPPSEAVPKAVLPGEPVSEDNHQPPG
jgi:hypothetical protein